MRKPLIAMIAVLCAGTILFAACSAQSAPAAPAGAPAGTAGTEPVSVPEPEPEPLSRFDGYVVQYEQENDVALAAASGEEKDAFFAKLYALEYSRNDAEADKAETSGANQALLEEYIAYIDVVEAVHEPCEFDAAVSAFIEAHPDVDLEAWPVPLFQDIFDRGLSLPYIELIETTGCDNPYAPLFIGWYRGTMEFEDPNAPPADPNAPHFQRATPEEMEEQQRRVEEWERQMEEEAAEAERNATNNHGRGNNF